jgi:hypothetical protein
MGLPQNVCDIESEASLQKQPSVTVTETIRALEIEYLLASQNNS